MLTSKTELCRMRTMAIPESIEQFWTDFLRESPGESADAFYESFGFDVGERAADELLRLVLERRKTATASLGWLIEDSGKDLPAVGSLSVIVNWNKVPRCVIRTTDVVTRPFCEVPASFALAEGEGDGSLEYWRKVHWEYFSKLCGRLGHKPTEQMPIVCENFELVYSK